MNDLDSAWTDIDSRPADQTDQYGIVPAAGKLRKKIEPAETKTNETFSVLYVVESKCQEKAFLKAMDFKSDFKPGSVVDRLRNTIQKL